MKNVFSNRKAPLFLLVWVFLGIGVLNANLLEHVYRTTLAALTGEQTLYEAKKRYDSISAEELRYHDALVNLYTVFERETGSAIMEKDDGTVVVRMKNDQIHTEVKAIDKEEMDYCTANVIELANAAKENGTNFLYVMVPTKGDYGEFPAGVDNYAAENYAGTLNRLLDGGVPVLDLKEKMIQQGLLNENAFFATDHHWKPLTGFWAAGEICRELNLRYGFEYDGSILDISNYTVETVEDCFLGSTGKKVGQYFTKLGLDDFDIITPKYETDLIESRPFHGDTRRGRFEDTVCFPENFVGGVMHKNDYAYYCGGDFRLQIIENLKRPEGKKILLVRDSFAYVVAPFLALETRELILTDVRDLEFYTGPKQNVLDLMEEIKPDYVMVLYSGGASNWEGAYEFD